MPPRGWNVDRDTLAALCRRHGIGRLAPFGSALRGDFEPSGDIDILVECIPGRNVGLRFSAIQDELSALFGEPDDLNTPDFLRPHVRGRVLREAIPLHEGA